MYSFGKFSKHEMGLLALTKFTKLTIFPTLPYALFGKESCLSKELFNWLVNLSATGLKFLNEDWKDHNREKKFE